MNIGEANDVAVLLHAITGTQADADVVLEAAQRLEARVRKALGAGPQVDEASLRRAVARIYGAQS